MFEGMTIKTLAEVEKEKLIEALEVTQGNRTHAAILLGISFHTLYRRLKKHGLPAGKPGKPKKPKKVKPEEAN